MTETFEEGCANPMRTDRILLQIDEQRNQLYILAKNHELADPEVVQLSQELDHLLNLYNSLIQVSE